VGELVCGIWKKFSRKTVSLSIEWNVSLCLLLFVVKVNEEIRMAVGSGQRPDLSVITGPETLTKLAVDWIERCWHQNPDERPAFDGIL